jgi:hypothetical protein
MGMAFMIVGQKWRIAPPTALDHEKPNGWRAELVSWWGKCPAAVEWESAGRSDFMAIMEA